MKVDYQFKKSFGLVCLAEANNCITNNFVLIPHLMVKYDGVIVHELMSSLEASFLC